MSRKITREYHPISNSYILPTLNEAAIASLLLNVNPLNTDIFPQSVVSTRIPALEADPLDPPEFVLGLTEVTSQRTLSIPTDSQNGISITKRPARSTSPPARLQYHFNVGLLAGPSGSNFVLEVINPANSSNYWDTTNRGFRLCQLGRPRTVSFASSPAHRTICREGVSHPTAICGTPWLTVQTVFLFHRLCRPSSVIND